jgi:hypothetical protein
VHLSQQIRFRVDRTRTAVILPDQAGLARERGAIPHQQEVTHPVPAASQQISPDGTSTYDSLHASAAHIPQWRRTWEEMQTPARKGDESVRPNSARP